MTSLTGETLNVMKNLPLSADHYPIAYDSLIGRYQNKRKLATYYWHSIVDAKPLKTDSADALRALLDTFNENTRALKLMQFPTESWGFILLNILLDKLTPSLREKSESENRKAEIPQYEQLTEFLLEYCKVFAAMSGSSITTSRSKLQGQPAKRPASVSSFVTQFTTSPVCKE